MNIKDLKLGAAFQVVTENRFYLDKWFKLRNFDGMYAYCLVNGIDDGENVLRLPIYMRVVEI